MTPGKTTEIVWTGPDSLRGQLVPIGALEPFPGNPRRADIELLRESLRRFGQVLPVLADPRLATDGRMRIIARHHLTLAAQAEGWTHVAVVQNEFADEEEARAYLLADNRIGELGGYEAEQLVEQLKALAELDALTGTGWSTDDLDREMAALRRHNEDTGPVDLIDLPRVDDEPAERVDLHEVVLLYSLEQRDQFQVWLRIVAQEKGTSGASETVYEAVRLAALQLNQTP